MDSFFMALINAFLSIRSHDPGKVDFMVTGFVEPSWRFVFLTWHLPIARFVIPFRHLVTQKMMRTKGNGRHLWPQHLVRIGVVMMALQVVWPAHSDPGTPGLADEQQALPDVSVVTQGIVDRSKLVAHRKEAQNYSYDLRKLTEEFDAQGQVIKTTEKAYEVSLISGYPFPRLVKIAGKNLSHEELAKEDQREQEFRKKITSLDTQEMAKQNESWITPELMERFTFKVKERTVLHGRSMLQLDFEPKGSGLIEKTLADKLLNSFTGSIWVDEKELETAKFTARLMEPIAVGWLGWMGALNRCDILLERTRMPDGVWINVKQVTLINGRKLFNAVHLRSLEESRNFKPQPATAALKKENYSAAAD
jgi:hypothetical protein